MSLERRPLYNPNLIVNEEPDVPRVVIPRASAVARGGYQQAPEVGNNPPLPNNGDNKFKRSKCHIIQASLTVILFVTTLAMIVSFGALSSHLLSAMNSMSERINSPGRLYESCHQETASCSFPPGGGLDYWMNCATSYLIINATGYYTTDVRCVIDTKCNMNMKTAVLHKDVDDISCHCNMVEPEKLGHKIMSCITGTCTLVITRCPVK